MMPRSSLGTARALALLAPIALWGGALVSQYGFGLHPCEMCYWQRWPHQAAIVFALLAIALAKRPSTSLFLTLVAGALIAVSGEIGFFHAGVEYGWWQGLTTCSRGPSAENADELLSAILNTPVIRCDQAQWTLFGVSLAGFNGIFSFAAAIAIWTLALKRRRTA